MVLASMVLPCNKVCDADNLKQRLRFMRESGESLFPHEHHLISGKFVEQCVNAIQNLAVAHGFPACVQMAETFYSRFAAFTT